MCYCSVLKESRGNFMKIFKGSNMIFRLSVYTILLTITMSNVWAKVGQYYTDYPIANTLRVAAEEVDADKFASTYDHHKLDSSMVVGVRANDLKDQYGSHTVYVLFSEPLGNPSLTKIAMPHSGQLLENDKIKIKGLLRETVACYASTNVHEVRGTQTSDWEPDVTQYVVTLNMSMNDKLIIKLFLDLYSKVDSF